MNLSNIEIKNFYSIGDISLEFNDSGIVFVEGKNKDIGGSNGSGKSSIFEAIVWGLYGKTIRKSTEEALVNNKHKKECLVRIKLDNGRVVIERTRRPNFLRFIVNGDDRTQESITATQAEVEKYFNLNYKTFVASTVWGQQNDFDFISASLEDKRIILKNFLNLDEVFKMRDKIKDYKSTQSSVLKSKDALINEYNKNIKDIESKVKAANEKIDTIKRNNNLIGNITLESIEQLEAKKRNLEKEYSDLSNSKSSVETEIKVIQKEIKNNKDHEVCYQCNSILNKKPDNWKDACNQDLLRLEDQLQKLTGDCNFYKSQLNNINIPISSSDFKKLDELHSLQVSIQTLNNLKEQYNSNLSGVYTDKGTVTKDIDILKFWEIVFSEQGFVKYIIRNVLNYFNDRCNHYLSYTTNGKFMVMFDDSLQEKVFVNGEEIIFASLSGGERKKINFAVLLALQGLLGFTNKNKFNLLLLDEVVESIDDESIQGIYNLLQELSKDKLILVITHNSTLKDLLAEHSKISLVKKNGITRLKN
jgi:DNA repair exonuclease SbcCD ATPase subunit